ncbi:hypothetical protein TIFTF001_030878 [Ficus carica]|uniref:Uncharacterized protein n=1 Tax=Ficus carica TaxID=3494 RepID=A0AA88DUC5_FICCA|nr:hypothetical protein TIFTF001_030878 [Ficus carica]
MIESNVAPTDLTRGARTSKQPASYCMYRTLARRHKPVTRSDQSEDRRVDGGERGAAEAIQCIHHLQHSVAIHCCNLWEFYIARPSGLMTPQGTTSAISNLIRVTASGSITSILDTSTGVSILAWPTYTVPPGTILPQPL